jgi:membrane protein involved in colicin uptake
MTELAAARAEVEAIAAADAARAAAAELEALRASSTGSSVSVDDDRDNELKLAREAAREQAAQWAAAHPRGTVAAALTGADAPTAAAAQTGTDASAAGLTEIVTFKDVAVLPPRTGTMVTMGSRPLSGTLVPTAGGHPQQDQLRRVGRGDEGTTLGAAHVGGSSVRRRRLL